MKALLLSALALVVLLNSCDSGGRPVPRPEGYPRIALYEAVYRNDSIGPVIFESNAGTAVTERRQGADGTGWLTLAYPRYGAILYLTASPATASTLGGIIDNRLERISLNIGGATTELTELTGKGGWHGRVTLTPSGSATPLQILATSPCGDCVVSGALFLERAATATSPDSLAPALEAVRDDLIHAVNALR